MNPLDSQTRAENVGSLLRSPEAMRAAASRDPGDAALLDAAVLDAIKLQRDAGVDVITDGELRRSNWADTPDYLDCFDKIAGNTGGLRWRGGENARRRPRGRLRHRRQARRRRQAPRGPLGPVRLPGGARGRGQVHSPGPQLPPPVLVGRGVRGRLRSAEEYLEEIRDALREVVDQVVGLGCDYIQLDAPNYGSLCDPDNRARLGPPAWTSTRRSPSTLTSTARCSPA